MKKTASIALICLATVVAWEYSNRPVAHPKLEGRIAGFAYSPQRPGQSPNDAEYPGVAEIESDIALLAEHTGAIRTYSLDSTLAEIPAIAARYGLDVTAGVWLDRNRAENRRRIERLVEIVAVNPNITRVIVGNEAVLNDTLSAGEVAAYLDVVRDRIDVPVGTAEPWNTWLDNPELAEHVDFVAAHILPYWEGVSVVNAVDRVAERVADLEARFPGLPILIGEVGWPSNGRDFGAAVASRQNAEGFLRYFLDAAEPAGYDYFLMEAIDQPWKRVDEGEVGAYWGLFDGKRRAKYSLTETFRPIRASGSLMLLSATLAALMFLLLTADAGRLRLPGFALLAIVSTTVANALVFSLHDHLNRYWTLTGLLGVAILLLGILGIVLLIAIEAHEWAEAAFSPAVRTSATPGGSAPNMLADASRKDAPAQPANVRPATPRVSIHVPACAEPPGMLIETLNALAELDYPDFEVLVIDNNTRDERLWRPVEAHCRTLGDRFRFFHVAPLAGYKAGALNYALERTDPDARVIAVIDSDYRVEPDWLRSLSPNFFGDGRVALVQAPQDYRDQRERRFKALCEAEYRGFFHLGMITRNERNAIIQHGTMTMIRADVLREVGGWGEWTVTEDAELGLRILEHGYEAVYTPASHGRGLTPDRFRDYRSQRFRWAIGAMQILRRHGRALLGLEPSALTRGQRFHFLTGWAGWIGDGLNVAFNLIAIGWSVLMLLAPGDFLPPVAVFTSFVLALFVFKIVKVAWLYRTRVGATVGETLAAIVAGLSLVYVTGRAVLAGLRSGETRFIRTPKLARRDGIAGALADVSHELTLAVCLAGLGLAVPMLTPMLTLDDRLWSALLLTSAIPHASAVAVAALGARPGHSKGEIAAPRAASAAGARKG